ncbi:MAG: deoxyribodipyrimidine photo-lyase [Saprospiraceae bacterium]
MAKKIDKLIKPEVSIFWFRRDLRLHDNTGLIEALKNSLSVLPVFIFDTTILEKLPSKQDTRVSFIHSTLLHLQDELIKLGSSIQVIYGDPLSAFQKLHAQYVLSSVYTNHDYEPEAILRDAGVLKFLNSKKIPFITCKDQVVFEKSEITKQDGSPYTVFTPYSRVWKEKLNNQKFKLQGSTSLFQHFYKTKSIPIPSLKQIGFTDLGVKYSPPIINKTIIQNYEETRNIPSLEGTTKLSVHLRFGTISIRSLVNVALDLNEQWLNELIWREFFMMILFHFPYVTQSCFKKKYNTIPWRNNEIEFKKWCEGNTGYPLVDAGMRELNETGFMHNRVRMVVASFLTKHLLIDWRWGEAYFADNLLDYELSSNNGNWQWAAGCGCDAAPYFRIFNPSEQIKRFDPDLVYIKKWVKDLDEFSYPLPMVDHKAARERALNVYKTALSDSLM